MQIPIAERITKLNLIAETVCKSEGVSIEQIKSKSRTWRICQARFKAFYIARKFTNATSDEIGVFFGGRNHGTILHGVIQAENISQTQPTFRRELAALISVFEKEFSV